MQAKAGRAQHALGMAVRTRFYSAKGQLLRSILHPRQHQESFASDSMRFIIMMCLICIGLYIWAAIELTHVGATPDRIFVRASSASASAICSCFAQSMWVPQTCSLN